MMQITQPPKPGDVGTPTGYFNLLQPTPESVMSLREIAHVLSLTNRWGARTPFAWSVASHSLLCDDIAQYLGYKVGARRAILMHDATEAHMSGDCITPFKKLLNPLFSSIEDRVWQAIRQRYGLLDCEEKIAKVDTLAAASEKRAFFPMHVTDWGLPSPLPGFDRAIRRSLADDVEWKFYVRATTLGLK